MVVDMMTANIGYPERPRRQYTTTDIARYQDVWTAANFILNSCVRGLGKAGWVPTGMGNAFFFSIFAHNSRNDSQLLIRSIIDRSSR